MSQERTDSAAGIAAIVCAVLEEEVRAISAGERAVRAVVTIEQGLHNTPDKLRSSLAAKVHEVEDTHPDVGTIVLGYGLCSRGVEGVGPKRCRLVLPRAHDCITLLLGSAKVYSDYVSAHPGTYWYSPGWNRCHLPPGPDRHAHLLKEYREKYGDDSAEYLMEMEQSWMKSYDRATYVDIGIGGTQADVDYTKRCAAWLGWNFDQQHGSDGLLRRLLLGPWEPAEFLVVEPGETIRMTGDERIVEAVRGK